MRLCSKSACTAAYQTRCRVPQLAGLCICLGVCPRITSWSGLPVTSLTWCQWLVMKPIFALKQFCKSQVWHHVFGKMRTCETATRSANYYAARTIWQHACHHNCKFEPVMIHDVVCLQGILTLPRVHSRFTYACYASSCY